MTQLLRPVVARNRAVVGRDHPGGWEGSGTAGRHHRPAHTRVAQRGVARRGTPGPAGPTVMATGRFPQCKPPVYMFGLPDDVGNGVALCQHRADEGVTKATCSCRAGNDPSRPGRTVDCVDRAQSPERGAREERRGVSPRNRLAGSARQEGRRQRGDSPRLCRGRSRVCGIVNDRHGMQETRPGLGQESPPVQGRRLPPALHEVVLECLDRSTIRGSIGSKIGTQLHHLENFRHYKVSGRYRDAVARVNAEARHLLLNHALWPARAFLCLLSSERGPQFSRKL
ncbi:hypothetical protein MTO96_042145 [Rhipicephalus appendiculatus]